MRRLKRKRRKMSRGTSKLPVHPRRPKEQKQGALKAGTLYKLLAVGLCATVGISLGGPGTSSAHRDHLRDLIDFVKPKQTHCSFCGQVQLVYNKLFFSTISKTTTTKNPKPKTNKQKTKIKLVVMVHTCNSITQETEIAAL